MTAPASLAFVAAPAASPTITLSLDQPGLVKVKADSFSLGAPEFEGDPYSGTGVYGEREVEFTLQFTGTYEEAATALQSVSRQLTAGAPGFGTRNWLMLRWSGSQPFFLQTFKSGLDAVDWRQSGAGVWEMPLSIACDGFLVGPPEDIPSFTITNDPSTGTNRMMYALPAVKGDAPAPLVLAATATSDTQFGGGMYVNGYALRGGPAHSLLARNLTQLTSGTDTGAPVTGAGTAYIDGDYKACTFATTSMQTRLSGTFSTALSPMPGTYRALLKVVVSFGAAGNVTYKFQAGFGNTASVNWLTEATSGYNVSAGGAATNHTVVDLGLVQFPVGVDTAAPGLSPPATAVSANTWTEIKASATLNSGTMPSLRFDELVLLPCDTAYGDSSTAFVTTNAVVGSGIDLLLDGERDTMRAMQEVGGGPFAASPYAMEPGSVNAWVGGLPTVAPGANNYLTVVGGFADGPTWTSTWQARYYPRYVHARPAAT